VEISEKEQIFSVRLRGLRGRAGLTQADLASKLDVSLGSVGNWESEQNMPAPGQLKKIAEFFGVSIGFLLGDEDAVSQAKLAPGNGKHAVLSEGKTFYAGAESGHAFFSCGDAEAFAIDWFGDSMDPRVLAGDRLLVSPNAILESGDLVLAKKITGELFCRIYIREGQADFTLLAYNSIYPAMPCKRDDFTYVYPVCSLTRVTKVRGLCGGPPITGGPAAPSPTE
jgi:transcriptional regulator with XRE-family HTH domain